MPIIITRVFMREQERKRKTNPLIGKKHYVTFNENDCIGSGGNGRVYSVVSLVDKEKCTPINVERNFVVKFLTNTDEERITRFKNEISFLLDKKENLTNVVTIEDYSEDYSWYLMKEYKPLSSLSRIPFVEKIKTLIDIANAIESIHMLDGKHAHRDIKPSNILIDNNGTALLADFGCVFMDNDEQITNSGENLGPVLIRPPELYSRHHSDKTDYKKSDVYLFAKTCWMFLKNDKGGFAGEYNPSRTDIYLKNTFGVDTLEPIQELIILSTKDNCEDRITIKECIIYLQKQLEVCRGLIKKDELIKLVNKEKIYEAISTNSPTKNSFGNASSVCNAFLNNLSKGTNITIVSKTKKEAKSLLFDSFRQSQSQTYEIAVVPGSSFINKIIFGIENIEYDYGKGQVVVNCSQSLHNEQFDDQGFMSQTAYLNEENEIVISIRFSLGGISRDVLL